MTTADLLTAPLRRHEHLPAGSLTAITLDAVAQHEQHDPSPLRLLAVLLAIGGLAVVYLLAVAVLTLT